MITVDITLLRVGSSSNYVAVSDVESGGREGERERERVSLGNI